MNRSDIIKWYCKYNQKNGNENKYENEIMNSIGIGAINTWETFKNLLLMNQGILYWKGALRTKHYYKSLDIGPSKWKDLFEIVKRSKDDTKNTVKNIRNFSRNNMSYTRKNGGISYGGISYPVASTLVYFFSGGQCPIIDGEQSLP